MSAFNHQKNVLERLRDREKSRDWSTLDKSYKNRSWSAESYKGEKFVSQRKPPSPQYLPRLDNRPASVDSSCDQDLKRGNMRVIPPVPVGQHNGRFVNRDLHPKGKDTRNEKPHPQNHYGDYTYTAMPAYYPHPSMAPPPHPPLMYPVPMIPVHPGYAPWPAHQPSFSGVYHGPTYGRHVERPHNQLTRSQAAVIMQKHVRGWRVRKGPQFALWRYMCDKKHSRRFIEELISSFLSDEIIPDILIDVLSGEKFLSVEDPRYKVSERVCREIIHEEVTAFIHEITLGVFYSHGASSFSRRDPSYKVCDNITNEVVKESSTELVHSTVNELVVGHMSVIKAGDWLEDFIMETIQPMLPRVVTEAMHGFQYDVIIDDIIDEVTEPQLRQVIVEAWRDVVDVDRSKQIKKVSVYAEDHMLDALCLQHLLSQLTGDNLSLYFKDYTNQALDGMICGLLTQQYLTVNDEQQATQSNSVIREFHQDVFCDVALDVLLEELTANLDEDIQEVLELEKQRNKFDL